MKSRAITTTMAAALDLVAAGHPPRVAASRAGVHLTSLYAAMRRLGIGTRCPTCGHTIRTKCRSAEDADGPFDPTRAGGLYEPLE